MNLKNTFSVLALSTTSFLSSFISAQEINPGGVEWADSYSVDGKCYCSTSYDHGIGEFIVDTPAGERTVRQVCEAIGPGPGIGSHPPYNDVQCGNGPGHLDFTIFVHGERVQDEIVCPGRTDLGPEGCNVIGPKWDLSVFENSVTRSPIGTPSEPALAVPGQIEAESFSFESGVRTGNNLDLGATEHLGHIENGDYVLYDIDVEESGTYLVGVRFATPNDGVIVGLSVDNQYAAEVILPSSGGWDAEAWSTAQTEIELSAGRQTLRVDFSGGGSGLLNLNWLSFELEANVSLITIAPTPLPSPVVTLEPLPELPEPELPESEGPIPEEPGEESSAIAIPGQLEVESYSVQSGVKRGTTEDGVHVGNIENGDYMLYEIEVEQSGSYEINARFATPKTGTVIGLSVNDSYAGEILLPNSGGWAGEAWSNETTMIDLVEGKHILRLDFSGTNGGLLNINWLTFTLAEALVIDNGLSSGLVIPGRIEVEDFTAQSGVRAGLNDDEGGGEHIGNVESGDYMLYDVSVQNAGNYIVGVRYSTPRVGAVVTVSLGEQYMGELELNNTSGWENWSTEEILLNLPSGAQTLRLDFTGGNGGLLNINWLNFEAQ